MRQRGLILELVGEGEETLSHLLHDLESAWSKTPADQPELVRIYNEDGSGARDPRTGAAVPHLKDVLRGHLDDFREAWRQHRSAEKS